jgi:hypothetical protein
MSTNWRLISTFKAKAQGHVWIVADEQDNEGYFKFTLPEQWYSSGPLYANEYIAARLARRLDLPVAKLKQAVVIGPDGKPQKGFVSVQARAREMTTWNEAAPEIVLHPEKYVKDIGLLSSLVVFDAWIANVDRANGKNLILHRNQESDKYDWYLIDHGLTLYGPPRKWERGVWNSPFWDQLWQHYHVPKGLLRLQSSESVLLPMIRKIEAVKESEIERIVGKLPQEELGGIERRIIMQLLIYRQKRLRGIIKRWLQYGGVKEFRDR